MRFNFGKLNYFGSLFVLLFVWMQEFQTCLSVNDFKTVNKTAKRKFSKSEEELQSVDVTETEVEVIYQNSSVPKVPKCCGLSLGFTYDNKANCVESQTEFLPNFDDWPEYLQMAKDMPAIIRYEYFIGNPCDEGMYTLDPETYPDDNYSIYTNGTLLHHDQLYIIGEFCLETLNDTVGVFVCFGKTQKEEDYMSLLYAVGPIISVPFLVATVIVYSCFEAFRDLRGKCLSCYATCLAVGYIFLALVQLAPNQLNDSFCLAAGFILQYFFVASFLWLNVISFDTWLCIRNDFNCIYHPTNKRNEKITFWMYSLYAWYITTFLSIVSLIIDATPTIPDSFIKPNIGLRSCWFYSDDAALPYFYGPVGIIISINVILFIMSAVRIYKEQKRHAKILLQNTTSIDATREKAVSFRVYIKTLQECVYLFCIMGINWLTEVVSWAVGGSPEIWIVTDLFNALQGVMIFYLFVIKPPRVRKNIAGKMQKLRMKRSKTDEVDGSRVSRHWHANIQEEPETNFVNDNVITEHIALKEK